MTSEHRHDARRIPTRGRALHPGSRHRARAGALTGVLVGSLLAAGAAWAQDRDQPPRRRNVIRLSETTIEGRIQKPQAFYILQRSNLNFEGLELKNSFIPKIIESVEDAPF